MFFWMKIQWWQLKAIWLLVNSSLMALLEINRNDIIWSIGPMDPTCTGQERMKPILFCYWNLSYYKKWMPPSPNWDGLPILRHFLNGRQRSEMTFSLITLHLRQTETTFWFLNPCFSGWRIQWCHWKLLVNYWSTWNSKWMSLKSTEMT